MITSKFSRRGSRGRRLASRALAATIAGGGLAAALASGATAATASAATASAAAAPAPAAGVAPGAAVVGSTRMVGYTAANKSVYVKNLATGALTAAGGRLVGAPALMADGSTLLVFGRGTDNQVWVSSCNASGGCGSWTPLGGSITAQPAASISGPSVADYSVYARGGNGALWSRTHTASGWGGWHSLGGRLLAGTGPAAAYLTGNGPYTLVVGTNQQLYVEGPGVTPFSPAGGDTTSTPALTAIPSAQNQPAALIGFERGTDDSGYYHRFNASSPGWQSMGGSLATGPAVFTQIEATIPENFVYELGSDDQIYENVVTWGAATPGLTGWHLAG